MTEIEDRRIRQFLLAGKREVADEGFSRRVAAQLPDDGWALRASRVLQAVCLLACGVVFYACDGAVQLWQALEGLLTGLAYGWVTEGSSPTLLLALGWLALVGVRRVWSLSE